MHEQKTLCESKNLAASDKKCCTYALNLHSGYGGDLPVYNAITSHKHVCGGRVAKVSC